MDRANKMENIAGIVVLATIAIAALIVVIAGIADSTSSHILMAFGLISILGILRNLGRLRGV